MAFPPSDTIIACASAPGRADRAIVRVSGPAVADLIEKFVKPIPRTRGASVCDVALGRHTCPAVVLFAEGPATYTGEDILEIILPGNPDLVERLIDQFCTEESVRRSGPGEFSSRAYLNNRLSLDEAEGVAALIAARWADDLDAARKLAVGQTGAVYRRWAEELATLLALVEAGIDFIDQEDVVPIAPGALCARVTSLRHEMTSRALGEKAVQAESDAPLVVLVGSPNAGKSTLFNALLGRTRSVIADESGTTRDVLIEELHLDEAAGPGLTVRLADLPGLDTLSPCAADSGWDAYSTPQPTAGHGVLQESERPSESVAAAQMTALDAISRADAAVYCDPHGEFVPEICTGFGTIPVLCVRTKADLPGGRAEIGSDVDVCALDGWNLEVVRQGIADITLRASRGSCSVALARHGREIAVAASRMAAIEVLINADARALDEPELIADGLRGALDQLEHVLGRVTPDEVIGRIFSTFCVGK